MITLIAAANMEDAAQSTKTGIIGASLLSVGGIIMIFGLCWYYIKSKCLFSDDDLQQLKSGVTLSKILGTRMSTF